MSKKLSELASLLAASNEQLFDRFINFRLTKDNPLSNTNKIEGSTITTSAILIREAKDGLQVITPKTGCKPNITVSAQFIPQDAATTITLTVYNMLDNIDTRAFNWCEIEVGYMNSGISTTFIGQIINCYMAKPNPNGELVIVLCNAHLTGLYKKGEFKVEFKEDFLTTAALIKTCIDTIHDSFPDSVQSIKISDIEPGLPLFWKTRQFIVGKSTRYFRSALECLSWLNSLFATYALHTTFAAGAGGVPINKLTDEERKTLTPLRLGFNQWGELKVSATYTAADPMAVAAITAMGSAVLTSPSSATITGPFIPNLAVGQVVQINPKFFKTRINTEVTRSEYDKIGTLWYINSLEFTFSTHTTNNMTLQLVNISNSVIASEG